MCNFAIQINCKIMNTKFNQFVIRHSQYFIYLIVFLLIFLNGVKRNPSVALTIAVIDTLFFVMAYQLFCLVFMHPPKWLQRGLVKIIVIILMIFVMSHLLFGIEYLMIRWLPFDITPPAEDFMPYINLTHYMSGLLLNIGALCVAIYKYSNLSLLQAEALKQERNLMKLQLLQSQINPHFLFNALNNIYALVYTKNDIAPDALMKLSDMLRYVTDYGQSEKVLLSKDLEYIQNYIDFQELRIGKNERLSYKVSLDSQSYSIAPMLLQPFVENCFKHSDITTNTDGFINIDIEAKDGSLILRTRNSVSKGHNLRTDAEQNGVGLGNVKQRLELYYQGNYSLSLEESEDVYQLSLALNLNK